jgi:cytochrome P450
MTCDANTQQTSVGVNQFAAFRHPVNFVKPTSFCPERWLPEGAHEFRDDNKAVYQPFSAGPRNCLGKA